MTVSHSRSNECQNNSKSWGTGVGGECLHFLLQAFHNLMFTSLTNVLFIYCFSLPLLCKNKTNKRETHILQPTETTHCQFFPSSMAENCYKTSDFL